MQTIKQILIIILASVIVMALFLPLAQTAWAENMRNGLGAEGMGDEGSKEMREMPAAVGFIAGFIKEIVIVGIPALITLGLLKIIKRRPAKV